MKLRPVLILAALLLSAAGLYAAFQSAVGSPPPQSAANLLPQGALLTIESPDFASILSGWNASAEKRAWLAGADYSVFSKSRLFTLLSNAQGQYAQDAGFSASMQWLSQIAGKRSILGWYNIGRLQFVYLSRVPSSQVEQSLLWQARSSFQQRTAAGLPFYLRSNAKTNRTVCFAFAKGWLVLATRQDLMAQTLALISGEHNPSIATATWYADAVHAAGKPGNLRMVLNLTKIAPSPYFRSYWIQQNITAMKQYRVAISDLYLSATTYREKRVLLPVKPPQPVAPESSVAALTSLVPANTGFYQAVAAPTSQRVLSVLRDKILTPQPAASQDNTIAPTVSTSTANAGSASDLQTRIDQAPVSTAGFGGWQPLQSLANKSHFLAMLQVESSSTQSNGVFTTFPTAIVLYTSQSPDAAAWQSSLTSALAPYLTHGQMGLAWQQHDGVSSTNGLLPLFLCAQNHLLILSNNLPLLTAISAQAMHFQAVPSNLASVAGFNHTREAAPFAHLTYVLDQSTQTYQDYGNGQAPPFFSGNIASLSKVFSDVQSETIQTRILPSSVTQSVVYSWKK